MTKKKTGRPRGLIKTLTTKKRKVEIIFPTQEYKDRVFRRAERLGIPVSKFIMRCVDEKMHRKGKGRSE